MLHKEMLWREKHPTATLNIKQLNNQGYSIIEKHLLVDFELEDSIDWLRQVKKFKSNWLRRSLSMWMSHPVLSSFMMLIYYI